MILEAQALDLYLRFGGEIESDATWQVLCPIANEKEARLAAEGKLVEEKAL